MAPWGCRVSTTSRPCGGSDRTGASSLFDAPWLPLYLLVIWLLSPWLGIVATVSALLLFLTGLTNELVRSRPLREANAIHVETGRRCAPPCSAPKRSARWACDACCAAGSAATTRS